MWSKIGTGTFSNAEYPINQINLYFYIIKI